MEHAKAHSITTGSGPDVVCLHSSMGTSKQWTKLAESLKHRFRVTSVDLYGYGQSPSWPGMRPFRLSDEIELIQSALSHIDGPIHLLGHSYGGLVATKFAQTMQDRVKSLAIYEPVNFASIRRNRKDGEGSREVGALVRDINRLYNGGNAHAACERFIDYWSGRGVWNSIPEDRQKKMLPQMRMVIDNFIASFAETGSLAELVSLRIPTLCMCGKESPASTQEIASLMNVVMPDMELQMLPGLQHMAPVTHAALINARLASFLDFQEQHAATNHARAA